MSPPPKEEQLPEAKPGSWYPEDYDTYDGYEHPEDVAGESGTLASSDGPTVAEEMARVRLALVDLVLEDAEAGELFEKQCREGLIGMRLALMCPYPAPTITPGGGVARECPLTRRVL